MAGQVADNITLNSFDENNGGQPMQLSGTNLKGVEINDELGRIVLVDKSLMEKWRKD